MGPITPSQFVQSAMAIALAGGLVFVFGSLLLRAIGKSSPARRRHGRFVLAWAVAGWFLGGAAGLWYAPDPESYPNEAEFGMAGFGLLLGWAIGMIHGGVVLALWPTKVESMHVPAP